MQTAVAQLSDICPNCGRGGTLNAVSGFCLRCTKEIFPNKAVCDRCGTIEDRGQFRTICQSCQNEEWLARNANRIEAFMEAGLTFSMAIVKVSFDNRPICLSCGYKIKGGTRGRHYFCRTTKQCRSAGTKLKHLRFRKGKSKDEALSITLHWLTEIRREAGVRDYR